LGKDAPLRKSQHARFTGNAMRDLSPVPSRKVSNIFHASAFSLLKYLLLQCCLDLSVVFNCVLGVLGNKPSLKN